MNVVYLSNLVRTTPSAPASADAGISVHFSRGIAVKLVGQIRDLAPDGATHIRALLATSIGEWPLRVDVNLLDLGLQDGDWVCVKLRTLHSEPRSHFAMRVSKVAPAPGQTAWLPMLGCKHEAGMAELRRLLFGLEPDLQGFFANVMADAPTTEKQFYSRIGALDHHVYPGGLFDQCLAAARLAQEDPDIQERDRGLLTMAALLFDLGKVWEEGLHWDSDRSQGVLVPHRLTAFRLHRQLQRLAKTQPKLATELAELLAPQAPYAPPYAPPNPRMQVLRSRLAQCVQQSWGDTSPLAIPHITPRNGAAQ